MSGVFQSKYLIAMYIVGIFQMWTGDGISVLLAYAQTPLMYDHVDVFGEARALKFGQNLYLPPYFVHASSEGFGESAHMRRLSWAFAAC